MKRERACKGCDGTGILPVYTTRNDTGALVPWTGRGRLSAAARGEIDRGARLSFTSRYEWALVRRCEPCLGTGRVTDHIPASDAVADAETLLIHVRGLFPATTWFEFFGGDGLRTKAIHLLPTLDGEQLYDEHGRAKQFPMHPRWSGSILARAAFRAVPGLRG